MLYLFGGAQRETHHEIRIKCNNKTILWNTEYVIKIIRHFCGDYPVFSTYGSFIFLWRLRHHLPFLSIK